MPKLVIAGGAGFIGSQCAEYFAKKKFNVILIDNFSRGNLLHQYLPRSRFNTDFLLNTYPNIKLFEFDLRDYEKVYPVISIADGVIFAAGQTAVTTSLQFPREDLENNLLTTFNVLECIRNSRNEIPFIYCSTNKVYGDNTNQVPIIEHDDAYSLTEPHIKGFSEDLSIDNCVHSPYGVSKSAADLYVQDYGKIYGLKTGVFRMSCIYGPYQYGIADQGWVTHFVASALSGKPITIYGNGKQVRDLLHVSDLVELFDAYLKKCKTVGSDVFNIGGGPKNAISILQLVKKLRELCNPEIIVKYDNWRLGDQKIYVSDIRKVQTRLTWTPSISIDQGLKTTIQWISQNLNLFSKSS
ncbi:MAG: nucleoside-diphosphate-sugar epimerase [Promethearchaeota archaeon CR_4]|nr:MAG: nucleoside-diphosphate-sugar epimerase [Candidatus Lokiarchaeota archaeon CR_4]